MNRAKRRRMGTKVKERTYTMTESQIATMKQEIANEATEKAFLLLLNLATTIIHDHYPKLMRREMDGMSREARFVQLFIDLFETVELGYVDYDGIIELLKDECGLSITDMYKNRRVV